MVMVNTECDAAILVEMRRRDETERLNDTLAAILLQKRYSQQQSATNDCTVDRHYSFIRLNKRTATKILPSSYVVTS